MDAATLIHVKWRPGNLIFYGLKVHLMRVPLLRNQSPTSLEALVGEYCKDNGDLAGSGHNEQMSLQYNILL